tara:strand:- start:820 stop:1563 length:744 start_codon:yes stop_codon:yes gene_type:complete
MSDTATEVRELDIRSLILDDSSGHALTAMDQVAELVILGAGASRFGGIAFGPLNYPNNAIITGSPTWFELDSRQHERVPLEPAHGDVAIQNILLDPVTRPISAIAIGPGYERGIAIQILENPVTPPISAVTIEHIRVHLLAKDTAYLVTTNYDSIFEHSGHQSVFDDSLADDLLPIGIQPGGFEPPADARQWSESGREEIGQPEVAVELEIVVPPKIRRTVVGTVGARFKAPFKTAFASELVKEYSE